MIEIWGKPMCPYCDRAKSLCEQNGYEYTYKQLDEDFTREELLELFPTARTFPQIKVDGESIGGFDQLHAWHMTDWNEK
tara:strand:- start:23 stop:259 length:237 start_codon:yes stop_codon:yes gene_type:complete